jgi:hypothetical protein
MLNQWAETQVDKSGTHHLLNGIELYPYRFDTVLKFHFPGLAPAHDASGAFHIDMKGKPVYKKRFNATYGFYCNRAAVRDNNGESFHIISNGQSAYDLRYEWCGNFQENNCVVKNVDGSFYHINIDGLPFYSERYTYVGDYKDGIAVVTREDGKSTHIDTNGIYIHGVWYDDLDVFHKGYACSRNPEGWFHVDINGRPAYSKRFMFIEPFYNNVAYGVTHNREKVLISESGEIITYLYSPQVSAQPHIVDVVSGQITQYWNSFALIYFLQLNIIALLPTTVNALSQHTEIPAENLIRLLNVVSDLGYIKIEEDSVLTTAAGKELKSSNFLKNAAEIWLELSKTWGDGVEVLKSVTNSFPSFKSLELNPKASQSYHRGLIGYSEHEVSTIESLTDILHKGHKRILLVGRQGISWAAALKSFDPTTEIVVYVSKWREEPIYDECYSFSVICLENISKWPQGTFDAIYFIKSMMHCDDNDAQSILSEAKSHLNNLSDEIYIVEPLVGVNGSLSGLNLNMLFECGGKLRTKEGWVSLVTPLGFKVSNSFLLSNNTLLRLSQHFENPK